jgi:hypothetical protein
MRCPGLTYGSGMASTSTSAASGRQAKLSLTAARRRRSLSLATDNLLYGERPHARSNPPVPVPFQVHVPMVVSTPTGLIHNDACSGCDDASVGDVSGNRRGEAFGTYGAFDL